MIYHIVAEADFLACTDGKQYLPADFAASGFVHCALEPSVLPVADDYYGAVAGPLLLLRIEPELLASETRYEDAAPVVGGAAGPAGEAAGAVAAGAVAGTSHLASSQVFPHVYGPIDLAAISGVGLMVRGDAGWGWPAEFIAVTAILRR